jgi:PAS domain S-box-containing protein
MSDPSKPDTPLTYVNDRFVEMTGYDREALLGRNLQFLRTSDADADSVDELRAAVDAGESVRTTLRTQRRDGEAVRTRVSRTPLRDEDGDVARWVGFHESLTGR